jgi:hypothetical protein
MRPAAEIREQLRLLKLQREAMPRHSAFGDDNHASLDRSIEALERAIKGERDKILRMREMAWDAEDYNAGEVAALDWVLCDSDDLPVEDGEADVWVKKALARRALGRE